MIPTKAPTDRPTMCKPRASGDDPDGYRAITANLR